MTLLLGCRHVNNDKIQRSYSQIDTPLLRNKKAINWQQLMAFL